jgi:uncharacterized protein YjiS (DUF1127 family)
MSSQSLTTSYLADAGAPRQHGGSMRAAPMRHGQMPHRSGPWAMLVAAYRRHRWRAALAGLDAHMLKDIGVSFAEAEHEANKLFWWS